MTICKFYTISDVAKVFNRSSSTIRRWIRNGSFPRGKAVPGGMIWTEDVLDRWLRVGQVSEKELKVLCELKMM